MQVTKLSKSADNRPIDFKLSQPSTWFRVALPEGASTQLGRRHIYILPTRFGWLFGVLLIALLIGSINYSISLGFAFTFLLAGFGSISMLHTWRNLAHISIALRRAEPVFAGENAIFEWTASEKNTRARFAISAAFSANKSWRDKTGLNATETTQTLIDIEANSETYFKLSLPTQQRGWLNAPRMVLSTEFPVSFFHVWAYANVAGQCLVYPRPAKQSIVIASPHAAGKQGDNHTPQGDDDFVGHRHYQYGDSPKRVDWKASSREQGMFTKQFQGEAVSTLWLDWAATTGENSEQRLSQLTRWVIDAETQKKHYGLRLPHVVYNPNQGSVHYHQCLTALALM